MSVARWNKVGTVFVLALLLTSCSRSDGLDPDPRAFEPHPYFQLEPIPNAVNTGVTGPHDALGLRGGSIDAAAPIRVLLLGGAGVYGSGLDNGATLSASLRAALEARASVGNGGCPGHGVANAFLRLHFNLWACNPTHVLYISGAEDWRIYAATDFAPDLRHVRRPWTGTTPPTALGPVTATALAAFRRDLVSLDVAVKLLNAQLILAAPREPYPAPMRAVVEEVARTRQGAFVELTGDVDATRRAFELAILGT